MKFSGKVGFWLKDIQTKPGVYKPGIVEKPYMCEVLKNSRRFQTAENQQNENLVLNTRLSLLSNLYMQKNWPSIKYVLWDGIKWDVKSVDITSYPRVIIELGGVYNGTNAAT